MYSISYIFQLIIHNYPTIFSSDDLKFLQLIQHCQIN